MSFKEEYDRLVANHGEPNFDNSRISAKDLRALINWSNETFGPGLHTEGTVAHIREELDEILADPTDAVEWMDVVILALSGALRTGATPEDIIATFHKKFAVNQNRKWGDWRQNTNNEVMKHKRIGDAE